MAEVTNSRRGFIVLGMAILQAFLFAGPREARAARQGAKELIDRLEMESLASARPRREGSIVMRLSGEETTLYRGKRPLCSMNRTGRMVWELCDGDHRPQEISRSLVQHCQVSEARAARDLFPFLAELKRIGAIRL